jgi:nucleotide-binding universal stress UspA family protein
VVDAPTYPFDRILVPTRPAADAERALSVAGCLARRTGVPVRLLSVGWPIDIGRIMRRFAAGGNDGAPQIDIESRVAGVGSVAGAIMAEAEPGTLVCMTSHGAYGPARTLAHTVAEEVVRLAREPVLLVGPHVAPEDPLGAGRVVACLDGARGDEDVVVTAGSWSRAFRLPLYVVHVMAAPDPASERRLNDLAHCLGGVDGCHVLHDRHPARALADLAARTAVAVFVMAPVGRTGWGRVLAGSVTASTVRRAAAPVLAVPSRGRG